MASCRRFTNAHLVCAVAATTVIIVLLSSSIADAAAFNKHHLNHHHQQQQQPHRRDGRSTGSDSSLIKTDKKMCEEDTPCGWAVYTRFTRVVDYFMRNTCECPAGRECIRVDDDVSVSAYVYRCRHISTKPAVMNTGGDTGNMT